MRLRCGYSSQEGSLGYATTRIPEKARLVVVKVVRNALASFSNRTSGTTGLRDVGRPVGTILNKPVSSTGFARDLHGRFRCIVLEMLALDFAARDFRSNCKPASSRPKVNDASLPKLGRRPQCGTDFLTPMVEVKFNSAV